MTVFELIEKLTDIEDKSVPVYIDVEGGEVYEVKEVFTLDDNEAIISI